MLLTKFSFFPFFWSSILCQKMRLETRTHKKMGKKTRKYKSSYRIFCSTSKRVSPTKMTGHWSYCDDDECGPNRWPTGQHQSPINIDLGEVERKDTHDGIKFVNYDHPIQGDIVNNGHSVQMTPELRSEHPEIYGGGLDQVYRLVQYHFHWGENDNEGSEHTLGGLRYPAELHLVHQGVEDPGKLAVVGVFLQIGKEGKALSNEERVLGQLRNPETVTRVENVRLAEKLPNNRRSFWRYEGSLTTPPCSEIVTWTIFTEPVTVTHDQLELFRQVQDIDKRPIKKNYRPTQNLNDRKIVHIVAN
ncbi:hypothetical protein B9Z55_022392 [Caenorhabditis nigoni]|uniref:Carbonic anhydrase n=1 Tax=Caenorhabditis nigoni TaxID=1611254 RepID=A0A2G5SJV8_9PELO|nr:hypothetical protein B9Z55_022392 [Caenorhabditis nigoni]